MLVFFEERYDSTSKKGQKEKRIRSSMLKQDVH